MHFYSVPEEAEKRERERVNERASQSTGGVSLFLMKEAAKALRKEEKEEEEVRRSEIRAYVCTYIQYVCTYTVCIEVICTLLATYSFLYSSPLLLLLLLLRLFSSLRMCTYVHEKRRDRQTHRQTDLLASLHCGCFKYG